MRLSVYWASLSLALAALAQAALTEEASHPSGMTCFTTKGTSLIDSVSTKFQTVSVTAIKTETIEDQSTTTIVPEDETYIKTVVITTTAKTTASAYTNGVAATSTSTVTSTKSSSRQTITKTSTITSTVTVSSTKTTTVPTTSGFRPVNSTIHFDVDPGIKVRRKPEGSAKAQSKAMYPQEVDCRIFTTIISTTVETLVNPTPYTMTASKPMVTRMTTLTVTSSNTVFVIGQSKVKVPILYTTTTTSTCPPPVTTTITITKTKTTTDVLPGPTVYAACLGSNLITYPTGEYTYFNTNENFQFSIEAPNINSGYDCCVACISQFQCAGGLFYQLICKFGTNEVCGPQSSDLIVAYYTFSNANPAAPIFNGYCGEFNLAKYND